MIRALIQKFLMITVTELSIQLLAGALVLGACQPLKILLSSLTFGQIRIGGVEKSPPFSLLSLFSFF